MSVCLNYLLAELKHTEVSRKLHNKVSRTVSIRADHISVFYQSIHINSVEILLLVLSYFKVDDRMRELMEMNGKMGVPDVVVI